MIRRRSKFNACGVIVGAALIAIGLGHGASTLFAGLIGGRSGSLREHWRFALATDVAPEVEEEVKEETELTAPVNLRESPWEAVLAPYQREAKRCWSAGADGKIPGYVAELYRSGSPLEKAPPPLRRRWLNRKKTKEVLNSPYKTLGITAGASFPEIRKAYLQKAREDHPDRGGDADDFAEILRAYRILKDEDRRQHYDDTGEDQGESEDEEIRWVLTPQPAKLQKIIAKWRTAKFDYTMFQLCGMKGTVVFDDFERGLTQVEINKTDDSVIAAWFPTNSLTFLSDEYGGEVEFDAEEQKAIVLARGGALTKPNLYQLATKEVTVYALGWRAHEEEGGMASPFRDAAFGQSFFKEGREAEETGVLLDLGCGEGEAARQYAFSEKFSAVFALDRNSSALNVARKSCEEMQIGPEQGLFLLRADAEDLPFQEQQIDYVWWGFGWEEVDNGEKVLRDLYNIMKLGGRLALSTRSGVKTAKAIQRTLQEIGFKETKVYPPRAGVFLNYAHKLSE
eukprot:CAMPEP_0197637924 /NCGR_PEP_ID=MMETSP1338-20131121/12999_1 /TAXON_ID=43686 ORGANISM="Pelagodinium beii, Strain RCC1491" /NCGR_SAMPLE_ID=MMETSP1338 /ASSEMBLY_ACC=CAM_ASM_000754 /LENGTH=509 /DNA_ID=CAMNT_0043210419 /DNA_START=19 /DNA_END=1548 /DNA_ORIENTATION=-